MVIRVDLSNRLNIKGHHVVGQLTVWIVKGVIIRTDPKLEARGRKGKRLALD